MGRLSKRLRRLERASARVVCRDCGGRGVTSVRFEVQGQPPWPPRPCRGCGRDEPAVVRVSIEGPEPEPAAA